MRLLFLPACACAGLLLCLALALAAAPARAQPPAGPGRDTPADTARYRLPLLDVTAVRGQTAAARSAARVEHLTRADFVALHATSLADALERRGGAFVRRYGPGGLAGLSLRGSGAGQTALLLDGLRLNDPQLGQVDVSLLPAALLDRAEVVHGAASAWHGSDAVGGAVLLGARRPERVEWAAEAGGPGTRRVEAAGGMASGPLHVGVSVSLEASSGRFGYTDRTHFPARRVTREGAERRLGAVLGTLQYARGAGVTTSGLWLAGAARGLPGPAGTAPGGEQQDDALARLWGAHHRLAGPLHVRVSGWAQDGLLRYRHPGLGLDETARTRSVGAEAEVAAAPGPDLQGGAGVVASMATAHHPSLAAVPAEAAVGAFVHLTRRWEGLTTVAAVRVDHLAQAARAYTPVSPRLGVRLDLRHGLAVKGGVGRSFRAPTLNDRFWRGAGRADLRPEQGWSAEGGLEWTRGAIAAEATAFVHALRDEILWQPTTGGLWRPENVRRTRTRGLEASVQGTRGRFSGHAFATVTLAQDRSARGSTTYGRQLRYVPRTTARGDAALSVPVRALDALRLSVTAQAVGARPVTADGTQALPPYALVGTGVSATRGAFTLDVRLENLFDTEYRVLEGYPMPGRQASVGLRFAR